MEFTSAEDKNTQYRLSINELWSFAAKIFNSIIILGNVTYMYLKINSSSFLPFSRFECVCAVCGTVHNQTVFSFFSCRDQHVWSDDCPTIDYHLLEIICLLNFLKVYKIIDMSPEKKSNDIRSISRFFKRMQPLMNGFAYSCITNRLVPKVPLYSGNRPNFYKPDNTLSTLRNI